MPTLITYSVQEKSSKEHRVRLWTCIARLSIIAILTTKSSILQSLKRGEKAVITKQTEIRLLLYSWTRWNDKGRYRSEIVCFVYELVQAALIHCSAFHQAYCMSLPPMSVVCTPSLIYLPWCRAALLCSWGEYWPGLSNPNPDLQPAPQLEHSPHTQPLSNHGPGLFVLCGRLYQCFSNFWGTSTPFS